MPSPFPGMDPYLEDPGLWPDVHHEFISEARVLLAPQLRPKYHVRIEERVYLQDGGDQNRPQRVPALHVATQPHYEGQPYWPPHPGAAETDEPIVATTEKPFPDEIHEARLEIIDRESRSVVTVIEVLSPSNKTPGSNGHESFQQKRQDVMRSSSHWVEIDLLRAGLPIWTRKPLPPHEYLAHVSRVEQRPQGLVWPIRIPRRLPVLKIPLRPEDPDALLDLQAILDTAYDRAGYDLTVDYTREAVPPLTGEWADWADKILKTKGLRKE